MLKGWRLSGEERGFWFIDLVEEDKEIKKIEFKEKY